MKQYLVLFFEDGAKVWAKKIPNKKKSCWGNRGESVGKR